MDGLLKYNGNEWVVSYCHIKEKELPVYYKDADKINESLSKDTVKSVEFEIIDEFSHPRLFEDIPWGCGDYCAKLNEI